MAIQSTSTSRRIEPLRESIWLTVDAMFDRHPDMIFFGNGAPAEDLMPLERLESAGREAWQDGVKTLSYGETEGYAPLRELIVAQMASIGAPATADEIIVVNGSQEGMDVVGRTLLQEGDIVLVEGPTFPDAIRLYQSHDAEVIGMEIDQDGIVIEKLAAQLDRLPRKPKFIYTIPTFQNPSGTTLPLDRRHALVNLARERGILLVEDDPYSMFRYDGDPLPPLRALEPDSVYLGTFSKTIAPGLRVGWIAAPKALRDHFFAVKEVMSISNSRLTTRVVHQAARDGFLEQHVAQVRETYRLRRDTLLAAMEEYLPPQATWVRPQGGFFVWVDLPEDVDTDALLAKAAANGVIFLPSSWFFPDRSKRNGFRLSFSAIPIEQMAEGVRRIGQVLT